MQQGKPMRTKCTATRESLSAKNEDLTQSPTKNSKVNKTLQMMDTGVVVNVMKQHQKINHRIYKIGVCKYACSIRKFFFQFYICMKFFIIKLQEERNI